MKHKDFRTLDASEVRRLLFACLETRYPVRNKVIVLLSLAGLKPSEISALLHAHFLDDEKSDTAELVIAKRKGKKLKARTLPIPRGTELYKSIIALKKTVRGKHSDPLILSERAILNKAIEGDYQMRPSSIGYFFYKMLRQASIDDASANDLRRTFIVNASLQAIESKVSIREVQELAGIRRLDDLQLYIEKHEEAQKNLMSDLFSRKPSS